VEKRKPGMRVVKKITRGCCNLLGKLRQYSFEEPEIDKKCAEALWTRLQIRDRGWSKGYHRDLNSEMNHADRSANYPGLEQQHQAVCAGRAALFLSPLKSVYPPETGRRRGRSRCDDAVSAG